MHTCYILLVYLLEIVCAYHLIMIFACKILGFHFEVCLSILLQDRNSIAFARLDVQLLSHIASCFGTSMLYFWSVVCIKRRAKDVNAI